MARKNDMNGLTTFLTDIRRCKGKEDELKRVNKELANIRRQFGNDALLNGYNKKKYISKLVCIYLLGYNIDFGHNVAINLLNNSKYSEKRMGYIFMSVIMTEKSNFMTLVQKTIELELTQSRTPEHQILALNYVANVANREMIDALASPILRLLFASDTCDAVKQSGILCFLNLFRMNPNLVPENDYSALIKSFLDDHNLGVVTAAVSLIDTLVAEQKIDAITCIRPTISRLTKVLKSNSQDDADYSYYHISAPWLTIKLLKLLKQCLFPKDIESQTDLIECIVIIFNKSQEVPKTKKIAHRNCKNAILFETIGLVHHLGMQPELQTGACNILEVTLKQNDANTRFLVLETMCLLAGSEFCRFKLKENLKIVIDFMQTEKDACIKRKLACLLYSLCDEINVNQAIEELFFCMEAEDITLRKEILVRISILAEKYLQDRTLYIDVILNILKKAGEYVPEKVWYKLIQVITKDGSMQAYAAKSAFETLETSHFDEKLVIVVGYILGEFGNLIAGNTNFSPIFQLRLLYSSFYLCTNDTKIALLTTFMKFANLYPNIRPEIKQIFRINSRNVDSEVQQRAVEYLKLCEIAHPETLKRVFDKMPKFQKETCVEAALQNMKIGTSEEKMKLKSESCNELSPQVNGKRQELKKYVSQNNLVDNSEGICDQLLDLSPINSKGCSFSQKLNSVCLTTTFEALNFIIWHEKGILYESNILRLETDTKFTSYKGQIRLNYTNKTSEVLANFRFHFPDENFDKIKLDVTPSSNILNPYEKMEQGIQVECMRDFEHCPYMFLNFNILNFTECIAIFLPLTVNKFVTPITMTSDEFFSRWNFCQHKFEKAFPSKNIMERRMVEKKIEGIGLKLLQDIDEDKESLAAAGIFHSKFKRIGILLRLDSDYKTRSYKLIVRSTLSTISNEMARLVMLIL